MIKKEKPKYDINQPWLTLDDWQKEYIETDADQDCFLLCGRQVGKTTAMSLKAVELCMKSFKKGEFILICSITEKQAYHVLAKALTYAQQKYPSMIKKGKERPTMHRIIFKNGTGIFCYAAGETGEGLRGYTIKKLMIDEASRMGEEFFIAVAPMISVTNGSMDIASTPAGKRWRSGEEKFFYKCSKDEKFKKFYVDAEQCPRHSKEFLEEQRKRMTKLAYAQEFKAVFTDKLKSFFDEDLIKEICTKDRKEEPLYKESRFYLGVDVAGFGKDEITFEVLEKKPNGKIEQRENIILEKKYTTETTQKIITLNRHYNFRKIGVDDGGLGFGVFSELMNHDETKRKTEALNNARRETNDDGGKKKLLKEEMYVTLKVLMEQKKITLLNDDEIIESLKSIQHEEEKIFGAYSHITEGLVRAAWICEKDKTLNIFAHTF